MSSCDVPLQKMLVTVAFAAGGMWTRKGAQPEMGSRIMHRERPFLVIVIPISGMNFPTKTECYEPS